MAAQLLKRTIVRGTTVHVPIQFNDEDGDAINFTTAGRSAVLRLRRRGSTGAPEITRSTGTGAQFAWTTQATGLGYAIFEEGDTDDYELGAYDVEWVYTDENGDVHLVGRGQWTVADPTTGDL